MLRRNSCSLSITGIGGGVSQVLDVCGKIIEWHWTALAFGGNYISKGACYLEKVNMGFNGSVFTLAVKSLGMLL